MGYFNSVGNIKRVNLPSAPEYWVDLDTDIKWGVSKHAISIDASGNMDSIISADRLLKLVIKDWNLDDENGEKAPINEEWLDKLDPGDALFLVGEAGGSRVEAEEAKKNSPKS